MSLFEFINYIFQILVLIYFVLINSVYVLITILAFIEIKRYLLQTSAFNIRDLFQTNHFFPVSIIVPAYNEELSIVDTVHSLQALNYPDYEIIVVSDGSKDATVKKLCEVFELSEFSHLFKSEIPCAKINNVFNSRRTNLIVIDKENGGKADAINAGINASSYPLISVIDADSVLEQDALLKAALPFHTEPDIIAVGGIIRLANGCKIINGDLKKIGLPKSHLARIQIVEYLRAFLFGRCGWDYFNALFIISGAFGIFRKDILIELGGYMRDCIGEDMDVIMRIHDKMVREKRPYRIRFIPDPVCWTEAPEDFTTLKKQRNRWQRGLMTCLVNYRHMMFNKEYKVIGMFAYPFAYFLEMYSPIIETFGYIYFFITWIMGTLNPEFALLFLVVAILFSTVVSVLTLILEELSFRRFPKLRHLLVLILYGFIENIGYRQLHSYWRLSGMFDYWKGNESWGEMSRKGFEKKATQT